MKAVVKRRIGDGHVGLDEVPEPKVSSGYALVRTEAAGICGSDVRIRHGTFHGYVVPVILGHEFAGTIDSVGENVENLSKGDRVVCETHAYVCEACGFCRTGRYNLCAKRRGFGYGLDGAFTSLVRVRKQIIHKLPDEISLREAAVLEPTSVALNALTANSRVDPGESVLVIGPGPIGLLCLQVARLGGGRVTVSGSQRSKRRLELAMKLGAESTLTSSELSEGLQTGALRSAFDVVVIAAGDTSAFEGGLLAARPAGRVIHLGETTENASFQLSLIERKNLTVQGSFSHNWPVWENAIDLVRRGEIDVSSLITHEYQISHWEKAFDTVESREGVKVLLSP